MSLNLNDYEAVGPLIRRKDASPDRPSPIYGTAQMLAMWKADKSRADTLAGLLATARSVMVDGTTSPPGFLKRIDAALSGHEDSK